MYVIHFTNFTLNTVMEKFGTMNISGMSMNSWCCMLN